MFRIAVLVLLATSLPAWAQLRPKATSEVFERRATILGGGSDSGKCTIEVSVDDQAEVEISDNLGLLRTIAGQASTWVRFECTAHMPRNMADFELKGIDGRGKVTLVKDPRSNQGHAVVRIEDPKSGREGYTFDLLWRGGTGFEGLTRPDPREYGHTDRDRSERTIDGGIELNYAGRGDGSLRTRSGTNRLGDLDLNIRGKDVRLTFKSPGGGSFYFTGTVSQKLGPRITAEVISDTASGTMYIDTDRLGKVRSISMSDPGRNRYDLRWHN